MDKVRIQRNQQLPTPSAAQRQSQPLEEAQAARTSIDHRNFVSDQLSRQSIAEQSSAAKGLQLKRAILNQAPAIQQKTRDSTNFHDAHLGIRETKDNTLQRKSRLSKPHSVSSDSAMVQLALNEGERADKRRILRDYVQFTPPTHEAFLDQYGSPPTNKLAYKLKLLEKIRNNEHVRQSLKTKTTMAKDDQDDNWNEGQFNVMTLVAAIDDIYNDGLQQLDDDRLIGRTDEDFAHHDCVWAAVAYCRGLPNTLEAERELARENSSREGEVEDSILYRIMENLHWPFLGHGTFNEMFPALRPGRAMTSNIRNHYNGRYLVSEDINAGGTQGHVFAIDVQDVDDPVAPLGYSRRVTFTDRQHERAHEDVQRSHPPAFQVYVWKVGE